jgi:hypothetical protein
VVDLLVVSEYMSHALFLTLFGSDKLPHEGTICYSTGSESNKYVAKVSSVIYKNLCKREGNFMLKLLFALA